MKHRFGWIAPLAGVRVTLLVGAAALALAGCKSATDGGPQGTGGATGASGGASGSGGAGTGGTPAGRGSGGVGAGTGGVGSGGSGTGGVSGSGTGGGSGPGGASGSGTGGASGVGGSPDAGASGTGGATSAGNPCSARAGLLFCDDFETAPAGGLPLAPRWTKSINGDATAIVVIDATTPAHSGKQSVHITGTGFQTFFVFHDTTILPAPGSKFYLRVYMRLAAAMTDQHNTFIVGDLAAAPGAGNTVRLGEDNDMLMMTVAGDAHGYLSNQNYYNDGKPGVQFTPGDWTCLEMMFDAPNTTIDTWVNGTEVPDMHPTNIQQDAYDTLRFGFEKYAGPVSDIWYDDVAIGTQPIGCD